ncbi:MAG: hypothetical protein LAD29_10590 [Rhodoferax sp.]|nr:hypothetical protein [Rhodoferax sp.]
MNRQLQIESVEGEISLVIEYQQGKSEALSVLAGAMLLIKAMDALDHCLLSSIDSGLEPVSILNDVQHSSLKVLLARALRKIPDEHIGSMDWKKWLGALLVKGKHRLLQNIDADAPELRGVLAELEADYKAAPGGLVGYTPPTVAQVREALDGVTLARASLPGQRVTVQTELGDVELAETSAPALDALMDGPQQTITNSGIEFFKVKAPDMLGAAQWVVMRNNRSTRVDMLHQGWLDAYHARQHNILPGDSLKCRFEEAVVYDALGNELDRKLSVVEVLAVITPPVQQPLL